MLTGAGILFSNALIRLNGTSVSYVPNTVVSTPVAVSIIPFLGSIPEK
jgi:hypothetical protein